MSLTVHAYRHNLDGKKEFIEVPLGRELAGFESAREDFWGADIMETLGLILLPSLREHNIHVEGEALDKLAAEITTIRQNADLISQNVVYEKWFLEERTSNILYAIELARECGGGVTIW